MVWGLLILQDLMPYLLIELRTSFTLLREAFVWSPTAIYASLKGMATFSVPAE